MTTYQCGFSGGMGGALYNDITKKGSRIVELRVWHATLIDAIQLVSETPDGTIVEFPKRGGGGGTRAVFSLKADEYITGIDGRYANMVDSLKIYTNKRESVRFGGAGGERDYRYKAPEGVEVVGFWGLSAELLDAIGVIFRNRP